MNRTRLSTVTGVLCSPLLVLVACSGGDSVPAGLTVIDSAGVQVVMNTGSGTWSDGDTWTFEEVFRVGGIDAGEDARFGQIVAVDVDAEGRVYAADTQAREVRVFEADGTLAGIVGSPGEGPGEIGAFLMGMFERDGEVWTIDPAGQGIQRFALDDGYLGAVPFSIEEGIPVRLDEIDAGVLAQRRLFGMDGTMPEAGDAVATIATETPDTLLRLPMGETLTADGGEAQLLIFAPEPVWDVADDGSTAQGMTTTYRIDIKDASGALTRVVSRDVEAQLVTPAVKNAVLDAFIDQTAEMGVPREMIEAQFSQVPFAEFVPMVVQLLLEPNGTLWVQRTGDIRDSMQMSGFNIQQLGSPNWDVFDPEGVYLGRLTTPGRFQPLRLIDGVVWGIDRDEFDVQSVVGLRVVR